MFSSLLNDDGDDFLPPKKKKEKIQKKNKSIRTQPRESPLKEEFGDGEYESNEIEENISKSETSRKLAEVGESISVVDNITVSSEVKMITTLGVDDSIGFVCTLKTLVLFTRANEVYVVDFSGIIIAIREFEEVKEFGKICYNRQKNGNQYEFVTTVDYNLTGDEDRYPGFHGGLFLLLLSKTEESCELELIELSRTAYFLPTSISKISDTVWVSQCFPYYDDDKYVEIVDFQSTKRSPLADQLRNSNLMHTVPKLKNTQTGPLCVRYDMVGFKDDHLSESKIIAVGTLSEENLVIVQFSESESLPNSGCELRFLNFDLEHHRSMPNTRFSTDYSGEEKKFLKLPFQGNKNHHDIVTIKSRGICLLLDSEGGVNIVDLREKKFVKKVKLGMKVGNITTISNNIARNELYLWSSSDLCVYTAEITSELELEVFRSRIAGDNVIDVEINNGVCASYCVSAQKHGRLYLWSRKGKDDLEIERILFVKKFFVDNSKKYLEVKFGFGKIVYSPHIFL